MSVIVEFSMDEDAFELGEVLRTGSDRRLEANPLVPMRGDVLPYLWAYGESLGTFERRVAEDGRVDRLQSLDAGTNGRLYRFDAAVDRVPLARCIETSDAVVESASASFGTWDFRIRLPSRERASTFHARCREEGVDIDVSRVSTTDGGLANAGRLSERQRELLVRAHERGYFEVPREVTLVDLAGHLGVSDQTLSERLRRAVGSLIEDVPL
jgi:predicted DNA binding protein